MNKQQTINGITYLISEMGKNTHSGLMVLMLQKVGRNGKVTKQHRPGVRLIDGSIRLGRWV